MIASRGKISELPIIFKFFNAFSYMFQPHNAKTSTFPILMKFQLFSSIDDHIGIGLLRNYGYYGSNSRRNNGYANDDDKFSRNNRENYSGNTSFRSSRDGGDRQKPRYQGRNDNPDHSYRRQGRNDSPNRNFMPQGRNDNPDHNYGPRRRIDNPDNNYRPQGRNDGFRKSYGEQGSKGDMKLGDDFFKFDGIEEESEGVGLGGDRNGGKDSQPSVSELLNRPSKSEQSSGKSGDEFLEKFKLGSVDNAEKKSDEDTLVQPPQEDKMEVPENADEIFKKMKQSGLIPNAVGMLDGLCKDGLLQEAMKLFGWIREKGTMPEVVVYTAVVEGFCQAEEFDKAKKIFRKMQDNGIVANAYSYTVLIQALTKARKLDDAVELCVEMLENGHSPNLITFTGSFMSFVRKKELKMRKTLFLH